MDREITRYGPEPANGYQRAHRHDHTERRFGHIQLDLIERGRWATTYTPSSGHNNSTY